jgi:hypothetical protein
MVRTIQTTRVNTNYIPSPRQAPVYPVVVEVIPMDLPRLRVENRVVLEDSSKEFLPTPTPLAESLAFAVGSSSSAPLAPAAKPLLLEETTRGDSGDDEEENVNEEANGEQQDHFVGIWPITEHYTSMFETGHFPNLLQDVLHTLGTYI